jgi:putative oxidoreductase
MSKHRLRIDTTVLVVDGWLARHSVTLLRWSLGAVFLFFGVLKFFPGVSPAEDVAVSTTSMLTFGLVPPAVALFGVALMEVAIGFCLLTGRFLGFGLALLGVAFVGILSPLVLLTGELFSGPNHAPSLLGQYVLKDVILVAAALVVVALARGARLVGATVDAEKLAPRRKMDIVLAGLRGDRSIAAVCAEHGVTEEQFFHWRQELLDGAARTVVACKRDGDSRRILDERIAAMGPRHRRPVLNRRDALE